MIHILSPAKSLDFDSTIYLKEFSIPEFLDDGEKLVNKLKLLSKKKLKVLMSISDSLTDLNAGRYNSWNKKEQLSSISRQAIFAFTGDVYQGLNAMTLNKDDIEYAQNNLCILSGMYGVLKPLDIIEPYRLEMGTCLKIGRTDNLYQFWKSKPTDYINELLKSHENKVLVNLASQEYFKVIQKNNIDGELICPDFKDEKNGKYKIISFYAKKARGLMSRYIIENRISDPKDLEGFDYNGYRFNKEMSKKGNPVFTREENQA